MMASQSNSSTIRNQILDSYVLLRGIKTKPKEDEFDQFQKVVIDYLKEKGIRNFKKKLEKITEQAKKGQYGYLVQMGRQFVDTQPTQISQAEINIINNYKNFDAAIRKKKENKKNNKNRKKNDHDEAVNSPNEHQDEEDEKAEMVIVEQDMTSQIGCFYEIKNIFTLDSTMKLKKDCYRNFKYLDYEEIETMLSLLPDSETFCHVINSADRFHACTVHPIVILQMVSGLKKYEWRATETPCFSPHGPKSTSQV